MPEPSAVAGRAPAPAPAQRNRGRCPRLPCPKERTTKNTGPAGNRSCRGHCRTSSLLQVMGEKLAQHGFAGQRRGLQKLAQLVHLNLRVDLLEPGFGLRNRLRRWRFLGGAGRNLNHKFADQRGVNGPQGRERGFFLFKRRLGGCSHDFTIQLGTGLRKRTATTVRSG